MQQNGDEGFKSTISACLVTNILVVSSVVINKDFFSPCRRHVHVVNCDTFLQSLTGILQNGGSSGAELYNRK